MTGPLIISFSFSVAAFFAVRAIADSRRNQKSAWRLAITHRDQPPEGGTSNKRTAALRSQSFLERLSFAPSGLTAPADRVVDRAGLSASVTGAWLIGFCASVGAISVVLWLVMASSEGISAGELQIAPLLALMGAATPWIIISSRGKRRQQAIERALPDMLDLLTVSIEAGLAVEGALQRVNDRSNGPLGEEVRRTLNEISLGRRRQDTLESLAARSGVPPLLTLVNTINQAERSGMQMGPVLRAQAEQQRNQRRQNAEERALKAPLKMLFPLALFIFPSIFLVVMGPAVISLVDTLG